MLIDLHTPEQDRLVGALLKSLGYTAYRTKTMVKIEDLLSGWPAMNGIWGQVIALQ
jgi:hypothetical protein